MITSIELKKRYNDLSILEIELLTIKVNKRFPDNKDRNKAFQFTDDYYNSAEYETFQPYVEECEYDEFGYI